MQIRGGAPGAAAYGPPERLRKFQFRSRANPGGRRVAARGWVSASSRALTRVVPDPTRPHLPRAGPGRLGRLGRLGQVAGVPGVRAPCRVKLLPWLC